MPDLNDDLKKCIRCNTPMPEGVCRISGCSMSRETLIWERDEARAEVDRLRRILDDVAYYGGGMACNFTESPAYRAKGDLLYDLAAGLVAPHHDASGEHQRALPSDEAAALATTGPVFDAMVAARAAGITPAIYGQLWGAHFAPLNQTP